MLRSIFPFDMSSYYERHAFYRRHFWCFPTFRTKNIHIYLVLLPEHTCYDRYSLSSKYYEAHAFYRKHFWCFSTFRTKNIHIYLVLLPEHTCYDRYSLSSICYERHAFCRKHFWFFSTFKTKNIHLYLVCYFQSTLATMDIPFRASITNRTRFIENISGVFPRLERRILSVAASALLL